MRQSIWRDVALALPVIPKDQPVPHWAVRTSCPANQLPVVIATRGEALGFDGHQPIVGGGSPVNVWIRPKIGEADQRLLDLLTDEWQTISSIELHRYGLAPTQVAKMVKRHHYLIEADRGNPSRPSRYRLRRGVREYVEDCDHSQAVGGFCPQGIR